MSDNKVFAINPDLFSFKNNNSTRKKEKTKPKEKIKVRNEQQMPKNESLRKKSILKMIRDHHSEKNKDRFSHIENKITTQPKEQGDFEKATSFFNNMVVSNNKPHNMTLKNNISNSKHTESSIAPKLTLGESVKLDFQNNVQEQPVVLNNSPIPTPKYGCLKNGNLPTYRDYMNKTRKETESYVNTNLENKELTPSEKSNIFSQLRNKLKNEVKDKKKKKHRKKTIRRTYKIGKSKIKPQVSVLISNKTMRNKIVEKKQMLKQISITEIRAYLIKHGFIKVGSTTPNDVLRKMYESALLICGDVQNHNKETLLYNFMNDTK
jgi:hypothetical protein